MFRLTFLTLMTLISCGQEVTEKTTPENQKGWRQSRSLASVPESHAAKSYNELAEYHGFMENGGKWMPSTSATVRPGDRVLIQFEGAVHFPRIDYLTQREVSYSYYTKKECDTKENLHRRRERFFAPWGGPDNEAATPCDSAEETGTCNVSYNTLWGWDTEDLQLPDISGTRVMIGKKSHHPGKIVHRYGRKVVTELTITPEMLENRESATLSLLSYFYQQIETGKIEVGYMGLGKTRSCPDGWYSDLTPGGIHGLIHNGSTENFNVPAKIVEYHVEFIVLPPVREVK